jgi:hypothetical protein
MNRNTYLLTALCLIAAPGLLTANTKTAPSLSGVPAWFERSGDGREFVSKRAEGSARIGSAGASMAFRGSAGASRQARLRFLGASPDAALRGAELREGRSQYFVGNTRSEWRTNVEQFGRVVAENVWSGVNVEWYAQGNRLEYDFVVAPGADPSRIRFRLDGGNAKLAGNGDLVLRSGGVELTQHKPVAYQVADGRRVSVAADYVVKRGNVSLQLGDYDRNRELVIDPVFSYASYVGGADLDFVYAVASDPDGSFWIAGSTRSDIPVPADTTPYNPSRKGAFDLFVAKVGANPDGGARLLYYTYIGGSQEDQLTGMVAAKDGSLYLTGYTASIDFPLGGNAFQTVLGGGYDGFLIRYDPKQAGEAAVTYSTFYGKEGAQQPQAVAVDDRGWATILGVTSTGELPTGGLPALQPSNRGGVDCFVAQFNPFAGTASESYRAGTFFGGNSSEIGNAIVIDANRRVIISGASMSTDLPLAGISYQPAQAGRGDVFFAVLDLEKSGFDQLVYSTYLGASSLDVATAMTIDAQGKLWVAGYSMSADFPVTANAYQTAPQGNVDTFLMRVNLNGGAGTVEYSTLFGAAGGDVPYGIALDGEGKAVLAGYTTSRNFPVKDSPFPAYPYALAEAWVAELDTTKAGAEALVYSVLYGGSGLDVATSVATDAAGNMLIGGYTSSPDIYASSFGKPNGAGLLTGFYLKLQPR